MFKSWDAIMRKFRVLAVVGCMLIGARLARATEKDDALAILNTAIKAHGGADKLEKAAQMVRKGTGTVTLFDMDSTIVDELLVQLPDRLRLTVEIASADKKQKVRAIVVANKDKGWQENGGAVDELSEPRLAELREEAHVQWVSLLFPLVKKDAAYELIPLKDVKIDGRGAMGVKVSLKGHPDISLVFDKENALLSKVALKTKEGGVEVDKEFFFSEHKEVDGAKLPMHIAVRLNGKKYVDLKVESYKFLSKVDEAQFGKP
jgi:hypothetical protein